MSQTCWPWSQSGTSQGAPASAFGALPASFQFNTPSLGVADLVSFHFAAFNPNILNCTIMGPRSIVYYQVVTEAGGSTTVLRDNKGAHAAVLEWRRQPYIQMKGSVPHQRVSEWLLLSSNRISRKMMVNNVQYRWTPYANDVFLTTADGMTALGRLTKTAGLVTLELTNDAMYLGLLESCIVAAIILQSGCPIE